MGYICNRVRLSLRGREDSRKPNPLIQTVEHRLNIYYTKIYQKKQLIEYSIYSKAEQNTTSQAPSLSFHLKGLIRYFRHRHSNKLSKYKMYSKVIKSHKRSQERSHAVSIELKSALSGLRQFLATESPLKMMNNTFDFTSKAHFVLKIF